MPLATSDFKTSYKQWQVQNFKIIGSRQKKIQKNKKKELSGGYSLNINLNIFIIVYTNLPNMVKVNGV